MANFTFPAPHHVVPTEPSGQRNLPQTELHTSTARNDLLIRGNPFLYRWHHGDYMVSGQTHSALRNFTTSADDVTLPQCHNSPIHRTGVNSCQVMTSQHFSPSGYINPFQPNPSADRLSCFSPTPTSDSAFSVESSRMPSLKNHEEELSQLEERSDSDSANGSYDDQWDWYDLVNDDQRLGNSHGVESHQTDVRVVDMEIASEEEEEKYDPNEPTPESSNDPVVPRGARGPVEESGELTENQMLCFLRRLMRSDNKNNGVIRYTIQQFVSVIPVKETETEEATRKRLTAMTPSQVEAFGHLRKIAPQATEERIVRSMDLLPAIIMRLAMSAVKGTSQLRRSESKRRRTPPRGQRSSESSSRSRSRSSSSRRKRSQRPSNRPVVSPPQDRSPPLRPRVRSPKGPGSKPVETPSNYGKGRNVFIISSKARISDNRRLPRSKEERREERRRGHHPERKQPKVRLHHITDEEEEQATIHIDSKQNKEEESEGKASNKYSWNRPRRFANQGRKLQSREFPRRSGSHADERNSDSGAKRITKSEPAKTSSRQRRSSKTPSLLELRLDRPIRRPIISSTPRPSVPQMDVHPGRAPKTPRLRSRPGPLLCRPGLLPDPGTKEYESVIRRASNSRRLGRHCFMNNASLV